MLSNEEYPVVSRSHYFATFTPLTFFRSVVLNTTVTAGDMVGDSIPLTGHDDSDCGKLTFHAHQAAGVTLIT